MSNFDFQEKNRNKSQKIDCDFFPNEKIDLKIVASLRKPVLEALRS